MKNKTKSNHMSILVRFFLFKIFFFCIFLPYFANLSLSFSSSTSFFYSFNFNSSLAALTFSSTLSFIDITCSELM